jgi:phage shock protein E
VPELFRSLTLVLRPRLAWVPVVLLMAVIALSGCSGGQSQATVEHLDPEAYATAVEQQDAVLLDVRTPAEFQSGHLVGAVNLDFEGPQFATQLEQLDKEQAYAVYCQSGNRSGQALEQMADAGFTDVYDLAGGIQAWQSSGGEIVVG